MDLPTGPTARSHRNHGLFSDHYLDHTLPGRPDWWTLADKARSAMEEIACVFESYAPSANGAQTEEGLVKPVLRTLRQDFEVQPAARNPRWHQTSRLRLLPRRDLARREQKPDPQRGYWPTTSER